MKGFEKIIKKIGKDKFDAIWEYIKLNPPLYYGDVYYSKDGWIKFEKWYKNKIKVL